jgi:thioesterase domain-containing protein
MSSVPINKETVRYSDGIKELMDIENAIFLEVGPGVVLSTLAAQYLHKGSKHSVVNLVRSPDQKIPDMEYLTRKIGMLWLYGTPIDWAAVYAGDKKNRVPLPVYPFAKIYYDVDIPVKDMNIYGQPGAIKFMKQAPRPSVPSPANTRDEPKTPYVGPRNRAEQLLVQTWEDILGIRPIGIYDNLLEMGVTSLKGITFVNRIKERMGEIIHVTAVFDAPTVAELTAYFSKHYPGSFAKITGVQPIDGAARPLPSDKENVTYEKIMRFRRFLPGIPGSEGLESPKNPRAIFVLSPPRTGSTLLRVILAGHPRLFAPPELNLLPFDTLRERKSVFAGPAASHLQGTIRALMEIKKCSVEEAQEMMEHLETQDITVKEFYRRVQEWIGDRLLVDKSPGYSYDIEIMELIELYFHEPLYIHLMRHPYGMIHSFVEAKMDLLNGQQLTDELALTRRELAEVIYTNSVGSILEFLKKVPPGRRLSIKFEELTAKPEETARDICRFLNLEFEPEMIQPYKEKKKRMTDGVYTGGQMIGDPKFHQHKNINERVNDNWKQHYTEDFLGEPTLEIARILGYAPLQEEKKETNEVEALPGNLFQLNGSPGAAVNIFLVHDRIGQVGKYLEFCKLLGPRFNCWGIEPGKLKNYVPQNLTIEDTAASYIRSIKKVQTQGSYNIFTWSFGGHIAFEMARQMEQTGDTVALLAFVDCPGPLGSPGKAIHKFSLETEKEYIKKLFPRAETWKRVDKITDIDYVWPFALDWLKSGQFDREKLPSLLIGLAGVHTKSDYSDIGIENIITSLNFYRSFGNAGDHYVPSGKIRTPIHYFRASESIGSMKEHWNDFCQTPVIYHEIVGDHNSIFQDPQVIELTRLFKEVFESINKN